MENIDRRTYLGSTEVAAILGLSGYGETPYSVWERKTQNVPDKEENDIMKWGKILEPVIISQLEKEENIKIINNNKFYWDPEYPFLGTHPDGEHEYNGEIRNNEVKTVASYAKRNWDSPVPLEYYSQVQYTMGITNRKSCLFTPFEMDARKLHKEIVEFDPEFYETIKSFAIKFWHDYVLTNIPPDYQVEDYKKMINIFDDYVEVDSSVISQIKKIRLLEHKFEKIEEKLEKAKDDIKMQIGQNEGIRFGIDILATWKNQSKTTIDSKMLRELAPSVYDQCAEISNFRVLRIKDSKK